MLRIQRHCLKGIPKIISVSSWQVTEVRYSIGRPTGPRGIQLYWSHAAPGHYIWRAIVYGNTVSLCVDYDSFLQMAVMCHIPNQSVIMISQQMWTQYHEEWGGGGGTQGGHFGLAAAEFWFWPTDLFVGLWVSLLEKGFHGSSKVCKADRLLFQKQVRGTPYRLKRTQKRSVTWQKGSSLWDSPFLPFAPLHPQQLSG